MPSGAYIKFIFGSVSYTWEGQDPEDFSLEFAEAYQSASEKLYTDYLLKGRPERSDGDQRASMLAILNMIGATVIEVRSLRTDGTIRCEDLPLLRIY